MHCWLTVQWLALIGLAALCLLFPPLGICLIVVLAIGVMMDR